MSKTRILSSAEASDVLARARHGHLAGVDRAGRPLVRPLHHAPLDGALYFHGRVGGSKDELLEGAAVFACTEQIAAIPSYWVDARRACPATTYYRSVQVNGVVTLVDGLEEKTRALVALMKRLQPEGGYVELDPELPEYGPMLRSMAIWRLDVESVTGRFNVGQSRGPEAIHSVLRGLWRRTAPGDLGAIETILAARPDVPRPDWLCGPDGTELVVAATPELASEAAELLAPTYWNGPHTKESLATAQLHASAWIGVRDPSSGRLVGTCAALGNRAKHAWIHDVAVASDRRGRGVGTAMLRLLLDHAALRDARTVALRTLDAHRFYERLGFRHAIDVPNPVGSTTMLRVRAVERLELRVDAGRSGGIPS